MSETDNIKTEVNKPENNESLLTEVRNMFRGLFASVVAANPDYIPMYYGSEISLYAVEDYAGFPSFPMADIHGKVTTQTLKSAADSLKSDTLIDDVTRIKGLRKILSTYHALMFEDPTLETSLNDAVKTSTTSETIIEEAAEALSDDAVIYEFAFSGDANVVEGVDQAQENVSLIYRDILRTGKWAVSPNSEKDPLVITKDILDNLVAGFADGAFEYVTVPETHRDLPSENRGFIRNLQMVPDPRRDGEYVLRAGFEFTNKDAEKAVLEGSIAGVSCGILFEHKRKSDGKLYKSALHHVALTNKPWIDGLGGWQKIAASEFGAEVVVGIEETIDTETTGEEKTNMSEATLTMSQAEIDALVLENKKLKLSQTRATIADTLRPYQTEKNLTPAVLKAAEKLMMAAELSPKMVTLADDNTEVDFNLADAVKEILDAMPKSVDLTQPVTTTGEPIAADQTKPPTDVVTKTPEEQAAELRNRLGLTELTKEDLEAI